MEVVTLEHNQHISELVVDRQVVAHRNQMEEVEVEGPNNRESRATWEPEPVDRPVAVALNPPTFLLDKYKEEVEGLALLQVHQAVDPILHHQQQHHPLQEGPQQ